LFSLPFLTFDCFSIAGIAVAMRLAKTEDFKNYQQQVENILN